MHLLFTTATLFFPNKKLANWVQPHVMSYSEFLYYIRVANVRLSFFLVNFLLGKESVLHFMFFLGMSTMYVLLSELHNAK